MSNSQVSITLYRYYNDKRLIAKEPYLEGELSTYGNFRLPLDISNPVIEFYKPPEGQQLGEVSIETEFNYNYIYVAPFHRYYFIKSVEVVGNYIYRLTCSVDVLMSFYRYIFAQRADILRNEYEFNDFQDDEFINSMDYRTVNATIYNSPEPIFPKPDVGLAIEFIPTVYIVAPAYLDIPDLNILTYPNINASTILWEVPDYYAFLEELLNPSVLESLGNAFQNPAEYITDVFILPFKLSNYLNASEEQDVIVGPGVSVGRGKLIMPTQRFRFYYESTEDFRLKHFTDYEPISKYHLQVPFLGLEEIDSIALDGNYLRYIVYDVDILTGKTLITLSANEPGVSEPITDKRFCWTTDLKVALPLGSSNANQVHLINTVEMIKLAGSVITTGLGGLPAANFAMGNPVPVASLEMGANVMQSGLGSGLNSLEKLVKNVTHYSHTGTPGSVINYWDIKVPILFKTTYAYYYSQDHNKLYGRPLNESRTLSGVYGFTRIKNIKYTQPPIVTSSNNIPYDNELDMITNMLLNGVYMQRPFIPANKILKLLSNFTPTIPFSLDFNFFSNGVEYTNFSIVIRNNLLRLRFTRAEGGGAIYIGDQTPVGTPFNVPEMYREITVSESVTFDSDSLDAFTAFRELLTNPYIDYTRIF